SVKLVIEILMEETGNIGADHNCLNNKEVIGHKQVLAMIGVETRTLTGWTASQRSIVARCNANIKSLILFSPGDGKCKAR
ncbi:13211_t:CDS:1, partial [Acaulospora morrowiae]